MASTDRQTPVGSPVDGGRLLVGLGALILLVSLFLDWYGSTTGAISAWTAFELVDILLALLALAVLYDTANALTGDNWPRLGGSTWIAGPIALVLVLISLITETPALNAIPDLDREVGIWLALTGSLLMTIGALLGRMRLAVVVDRDAG